MTATAAELGLSEIQYRWARAVVGRIQAKGYPLGPAIADIALATCIVESGLRMYANANNARSLQLPHDAVGSDHGSVGLYQQQVGGAVNSTANWGTTDELMDAGVSTDKFVGRLLSFDWASMPPGVAAQHVQGSAFPDRYGQQIDRARAIRTGLWTGGDWFDMASLDDLKAAVRAVLNEGTGTGQKSWADTEKSVLGTVQGLVNKVNALDAKVTALGGK